MKLKPTVTTRWVFCIYMSETFYPTSDINQLIGLGFSDLGNKNSQYFLNKGYGGNTIVYSIISKIVNTALELPLIVIDENEELIESGQLFDSLQQPGIYRGEFINTRDWVEITMTYLLATGNVYQKIESLTGVTGLPQLEVIPSGIIVPKEPNSYLKPASGYIITDKQNQTPLTYDEVVHTKYVNPTKYGLNSLVGLSPLQAGLYSLTGSTDVNQALAVMIKNQGARGVLTPKSNNGVAPNPNLLKKLADLIKQKIQGIDKVNSVHVSNQPLDYISMGMTASDLELIESGVLTDRQICNLYNVDSKLFNDPSASTFNNLQEAIKGLYENAIIPTLTKVVDSFNYSIGGEFNKESGNKQKVIIDTAEVPALQADKKLQAEVDKAKAKVIDTIIKLNLSVDSKVNALMFSLTDLTEEEAKKIVGNGTSGED